MTVEELEAMDRSWPSWMLGGLVGRRSWPGVGPEWPSWLSSFTR